MCTEELQTKRGGGSKRPENDEKMCLAYNLSGNRRTKDEDSLYPTIEGYIITRSKSRSRINSDSVFCDQDKGEMVESNDDKDSASNGESQQSQQFCRA